MAAYGGELFGNNNPNPYQVFRDQQMIALQQKRLADQDAREQRRNDAKVGNAIRTMFDKAHLTTGTGADPVINDMLMGLMEKYTKLYQESKGSLDLTDITLPAQADVARVKAYYDNVNVIKNNVMESAEAVAKQYPGFNKQELYQKSMDRALYKDGQVIKNLEEFNLQGDFVNDVIDKDYGALNIGTKGMYDTFNKMPLTTADKDIVTRNKNGVETRVRGKASYIPEFQDITYDEETGEPKISLKTNQVTRPDGTPYVDQVTGQPLSAIDENTYRQVVQNRQLGARINQLADQKYEKLAASGVKLDESDREIFRREAATSEMEGQFKSRTSFLSSNKRPLPRGHRYKVGSASDPIPFDLEAAPHDKDGNIDLTGQLGGFTIKDPSGRGGNTSADILLTTRGGVIDGGLIVRAYDVDQYGNRTNPRPDQRYYGQAAKNFVISNNGWAGNNKKDMYKMLEQFDGSGQEPEGPSKHDFNKPLHGPDSDLNSKPKTTPSKSNPASSVKSFNIKGQKFTYKELKDAGWTDDQIKRLK